MHFLSYSGNLQKADSLFVAGEYFQSAIEYERLVFYEKDYKARNEFRYKKALCYKNLESYQEALDELIKLSLFGIDTLTQARYLYETTIVSYLAEDFARCQTSMLQLAKFTLKPEQALNVYLVGALNEIMLVNFEESKNYARKFLLLADHPANEQEIDQILSELYHKRNLPKIKNEKVFDWLSIAPGFGQIYTGKVGEGLANIGLNLAALGFGVYQVLQGFYITGYFVGTLAINKFYFGGRTRATNLFTHTNQERLITFNQTIRKELAKSQKTQKN